MYSPKLKIFYGPIYIQLSDTSICVDVIKDMKKGPI